MPWIRKNPFGRHEDPVKHMVSLLVEEGDNSGSPLSDAEKTVLAREFSPRESLPEELRQKTKKLIRQILEKEQAAEGKEDPKSFSHSVEWAGEPDYPNIVALAEEVITDGGFGGLPSLHGRRWIKDRVQLIGCALVTVLLMFLIIVILSIFEKK